MTIQAERLPYGIGKISARWTSFVILLLALITFGVYAYSLQLTEGEVVTGMRDIGTMAGVPWGLYIAFVVYFVGISFAGITVAALIRLMKLEQLKPISRIAELLTVVSLILGALCILVDIGQPVRGIVNLFKYARPESPFFGTFTLVIAGYLFASLVYLYLDGRRDASFMAKKSSRLKGFYRAWAAGYSGTPAERERHSRASFWLALGILPILIAAHSTLGFVFGLQVGRPGWFSGLQAPGFVVLAGVSGVGLLIVLAAIYRKVLNEENKIGKEVFSLLGKFLMILTIAYLYFMLVEWLTTTYSAHQHELRISQALLSGEYSIIFWSSVAALVLPVAILLAQFIRGRFSIGWTVLSGLLVNYAAIGKRYLIVIPSQTHGTLLPYDVGSYSPTWVEYAVVAGLISLGGLMFALFTKLFPLTPVSEPVGGGE
jgi:molybdopterin-containing oxidoreductase family membrane subunit